MIIKPKIRGFICTTAHPTGCEHNVKEQIEYVLAQRTTQNIGPKRVLVIGSSSGYGLASRIVSGFGYGAATIGVFFEKPATEDKLGTAGWYNSAAFEKFAHEANLYAKSFNGDAFSHAAKEQVITTIQQDLGQIDLVIYSLAAPVRKHPDTGEVIRSSLKPVGQPYTAVAVDTNKDTLFEATIEPATAEEVASTVEVMGGDDWRLWIEALDKAGVLAPHCETLAYSYIGTELTWPIYWEGALGAAKKDLDETALKLNQHLQQKHQGHAHIAVLKSVVTQASSAIPVMPLYIAMVFKKMREAGLHEGCIEQIQRLFAHKLYKESQQILEVDEKNRLRLDDWELTPEIQQHCKSLWPTLTNENLKQLTDYENYKAEFLKLFGFGVKGVDYERETDPKVPFNAINIE